MSDTPRKASLLVIFLTVFIDLLGFGMVLPLLPIYAKDFALQLGLEEGHSQVGLLIGLLMSSFSVMQFLFAPLWGRLSDRIGRRPVLMVGLAGSVVFYTLFGVATVLKSLPLLFVSRIGAGIAGATISTAQAYIADATSLENRAKGMALIGAAFGLGFTFGPLFGFLAVPSGSGRSGARARLCGRGAVGRGAGCWPISNCPRACKPGNQAAARHWFDRQALRDALATPAIGVLLLAIFVCVFSFANFESTLSLMVKRRGRGLRLRFRPGLSDVRVHRLRAHAGARRHRAAAVGPRVRSDDGHRRHAGRDRRLRPAGPGRHARVAGAVVRAAWRSWSPALRSSRRRSIRCCRAGPIRRKQGGILGIGQSIASLARIVGPDGRRAAVREPPVGREPGPEIGRHAVGAGHRVDVPRLAASHPRLPPRAGLWGGGGVGRRHSSKEFGRGGQLQRTDG